LNIRVEKNNNNGEFKQIEWATKRVEISARFKERYRAIREQEQNAVAELQIKGEHVPDHLIKKRKDYRPYPMK
jgi:hypothetical protein